jgi:hypothetical protein
MLGRQEMAQNLGFAGIFLYIEISRYFLSGMGTR